MAQSIERKCAIVSNKTPLTTHSAMSMLKKAAAGITESSTDLHKTLYAEKCLLEALDKHILAKAEDADAWTNYMTGEDNPAIKRVYIWLAELDRIWVIVQQRYRLQFSEQRKLFKQLLQGEKEVAKLRNEASATAKKVAKLKKQADEAYSNAQTKKAERKKLQTLTSQLHTAFKEDKKAQKQHALALENYKKYKYNTVKKLLKTLTGADLELNDDCLKISEVKSQIFKLYFEKSLDQDRNKLQEASTVSRGLLVSLCEDLRIAIDRRAEVARPTDTSAARNSFELGVLETEAIYVPIPDKEDSDDEFEANYVYFTDGKNIADMVANEEDFEYVSDYLYLVDKDYSTREGEDEIFGSIASLKLKPATDDVRAKDLSLSTDDQKGYGLLWESRSTSSSASFGSSGAPSRRASSGYGTSTESQRSSVGSVHGPPMPAPRKNKPSTVKEIETSANRDGQQQRLGH